MNEQQPTDGNAWPSPASAWYAAIILMMANTLAFIDRQALALLVQPIKEDLQVSDTAMSLLYGLSLVCQLLGSRTARTAATSWSRR